MGKITKKSINALMDIYKRNATDTVLKMTDPQDSSSVIMEIALKTSLTIPEKGVFVDRVVFPCFDAEGDFMPQYLDPLFVITLLQMTTNVPPIEDVIPIMDEDGNETGEKTTIINIEKTYELCKAINLVKNATDGKYQALINELHRMVTDKLAYVKDINARKASNSLAVLKPMLDAANETDNNKRVMETLSRIASEMGITNMATSDNVISISDGK